MAEETTFTTSELKQYDGKNGNKAYVAIDGLVYDLSAVPAWYNGDHHGLHAGNDLSAEIMRAPHQKSVLAKLQVVGKLV